MVATLKYKTFSPGEPASVQKLGTFVGSEDAGNLKAYKVAKVALIPGIANALIFAWQNPEANKILVHEVIVRLGTAGGTALAAMDIGVVANAAATSDTIYDGVLVNFTGVYSSHNVTDTVGANATEKPHIVDEKGGALSWITGRESAAQITATLAGSVYIFYTEI